MLLSGCTILSSLLARIKERYYSLTVFCQWQHHSMASLPLLAVPHPVSHILATTICMAKLWSFLPPLILSLMHSLCTNVCIPWAENIVESMQCFSALSPAAGLSQGCTSWQSPGKGNTILWLCCHHWLSHIHCLRATLLLLIWTNYGLSCLA